MMCDRSGRPRRRSFTFNISSNCVVLLGTRHAGAFSVLLMSGREPLEFLPNVVCSRVGAGEVDVCTNNGSVQKNAVCISIGVCGLE